MLQTSDPQQAILLFENVITQAPTDAASYLNLGFAQLAIGQKTVGEANLNKAVALHPAYRCRIPGAAGCA